MTTKLKDLAVKTGTYEKNGETKGRYENIGAIMESDDGGMFVLLKRTFNPAGVSVEPGRDMLLVSAFEPKDDDRDQAPAREQRAARPQQQSGGSQGPRGGDVDSDIPFAPYESRARA